jgi:hypothetical protein
MITEDYFKWTDELVKEFTQWYKNICHPVYDLIHDPILEFKQFKKPKRDYDIVSGNTYMGITNGSKSYLLINSVKRLSDGVVFSVGDITTSGIIEEFIELWCGLEVHFTNKKGELLSKIEKEKTVLFTSNEGVQLKEGDYGWLVFTTKNSYKPGKTKIRKELFPLFDYQKLFITEEEAINFCALNKPHISSNEIFFLIEYCNIFSINESSTVLREKLIEFSKQKLKND